MRLLILLLVFFISATGCYKEIQSEYELQLEEYKKEIIPLGSTGNEWYYSVTEFDSLHNRLITYSKMETNSDATVLFPPAVYWDPTTSSKQPIEVNNAFSHLADWYFSGSESFVYTPYQDGEEKGLLCGLNMLDAGQLYWLKLPRKPTQKRSSQLTLFFPTTDEDSTSLFLRADIDTTTYSVTVPAGTFICYKLILYYEGEICGGGTCYKYITNTIYLSPGVGVVKRLVWDSFKKLNEETNQFYTIDNRQRTYVLTGWKF